MLMSLKIWEKFLETISSEVKCKEYLEKMSTQEIKSPSFNADGQDELPNEIPQLHRNPGFERINVDAENPLAEFSYENILIPIEYHDFNKTIEYHLNLEDQNLNDDEAIALAEALKQNPKIVSLSLKLSRIEEKGKGIGPKGAEALSKVESLFELNLKGNQIDEGFLSLAKNTTLLKLEVDFMALCDDLIEEFVDLAILHENQITSLSISANLYSAFHIGFKSIEALSRLKLWKLSLNNCDLGSREMGILAKNTTIHELSIINSSIHGFENRFTELAENKTLKKLTFKGFSSIDDAEIKSISEMHLDFLNLSYFEITKERAEILAQNQFIKELNLEDNFMLVRNNVACLILNNLNFTKNLTKIDIRSWGIDHKIIMTLVKKNYINELQSRKESRKILARFCLAQCQKDEEASFLCGDGQALGPIFDMADIKRTVNDDKLEILKKETEELIEQLQIQYKKIPFKP